MQFMYLWPLFLLILIPIVIIMYLLKQKAAPLDIPSLFLWKEMYQNKESDSPWEKLKKNRLLIAQLITISIIIFALLSPYIAVKAHDSDGVILLIDNSGSMSTLSGNGKTRLENAKSQAASYISTLPSDTEITVLSCSNQAVNVISKSRDHLQVRSAIYSIKPTSLAGDNLRSGITLCQSIVQGSTANTSVVAFTDSHVSFDKLSGTIYSFQEKVENVCINYVDSMTITDSGLLKVRCNIQNFGTQEFSSDLNLYGDGKLIAVTQFTVAPDSNVTVDFDNLKFNGDVLCVEVNTKDALELDSIAYCLTKKNTTNKILLMTEQNLFLEKAVGLVENVKLEKTTDTDVLSASGDYNLYVFDGMRPEKLPEKGNLLFINCSADEYYTSLSEPLGSEKVFIADSSFTGLIKGKSFGVSSSAIFNKPLWAENLIYSKSDGAPCIAFAGEYNNRRICAIGFDFHDSDFTVKMEYPIFMYSVLQYLSNSSALSTNTLHCGEALRISSQTGADTLSIKTPDGDTINYAESIIQFDDTLVSGLYTLKDGEEKCEYFVVNYDPSESDQTGTLSSGSEQLQGNAVLVDATQNTIKNYRSLIVAIALLALAAEWIIYLKD